MAKIKSKLAKKIHGLLSGDPVKKIKVMSEMLVQGPVKQQKPGAISRSPWGLDYQPLYPGRSREEHDHIRRSIQFDPKACRHLKGMGKGINLNHKDYNISHHVFIDGRERVRCLNCRKDWFRGTPDWEEAKKMIAQTTNGKSASEQPGYQVVEKKDGPAIFFHTLEEIRRTYPDWDGVVLNWNGLRN